MCWRDISVGKLFIFKLKDLNSKEEWRHVCNHCPGEAKEDVLRDPVAKKKKICSSYRYR